MMSDFGTEGSSYSPDRFYVASADKNGHSHWLKMRIPPAISGHISALVASGKIPQYRTVEDFYRDAVLHRLHSIEEMDDEVLLSPAMVSMRDKYQAIAELELMKRQAETDQNLHAEAVDLASTSFQYSGTLDEAEARAQLIEDESLRNDAIRVINRFRH
jgi:hypothetical protein